MSRLLKNPSFLKFWMIPESGAESGAKMKESVCPVRPQIAYCVSNGAIFVEGVECTGQ